MAAKVAGGTEAGRVEAGAVTEAAGGMARERLVVVASGSIAWAASLGLPLASSRPSALAWGGLVALVPLAVGAAAWRRRGLRDAMLLGAFPFGLLLAVALAPRWTLADAHPLATRVVGALALLAYGAAAALTRPAGAPPGLVVKPLPVVATDRALERRARLRRLLLTLGALGALALAVVAPAIGPDVADAFGAESAAAAEVLVASIGASLGVVVLAAFVGPATRRRREAPRGRRGTRVALYLVVVGVGLFVLQALSARS